MGQENIKEKHHFVFQAYLQSWTDKDEKIYSLFRKSKKLHTKTDKIAFKPFFYSVKPISQDELDFLLRVLPLQNESIKKAFFDHVGHYQEPLESKKAVQEIRVFTQSIYGNTLPDGIEKQLMKLEHLAAVMINNVMEEFYGEIEGAGMNWIRQLKNKDTSFYSSKSRDTASPAADDDQYSFLYFLCTQYFRTNALKERWITEFGKALDDPRMESLGFEKKGINMENLVHPTFWLFANRCAFQLWKQNAHLTLLVNDTKIPFITCDQPVINLKANYQNLNEFATELVFYYPVSPQIAITINDASSADRIELNQQTVEEYNNAIADASYESIFTSTGEMIDRYKDYLNSKC